MQDKNLRKQGSRYDKILRENMPFILPGIMKNIFKLNLIGSVPLKDKIQITRQKEVDALSLVTDADGKSYLVQVEFESANKKKMNFRMAEYRAMLHQIYDHPVKQYVIYMGKACVRTPYRINLPGFKYEYTLINFSELPHEMFLSSNEPEEQILTVLANLGNTAPEEVIKAVLKKIAKNSHEGLTNNKYYEQLRVIVQLRNFDDEIDTAMLEVNTFWKKERDTLYKWGRQEEHAKMLAKALEEKKAIARNFKNKDIDLNIIADATGLTIEEIESL